MFLKFVVDISKPVVRLDFVLPDNCEMNEYEVMIRTLNSHGDIVLFYSTLSCELFVKNIIFLHAIFCNMEIITIIIPLKYLVRKECNSALGY